MSQGYDEMAKEITVAAASNPNFMSNEKSESKIKLVCDLYKQIYKAIIETK